jgi:2-iminobutanoate/2-iminopropanoate deaminase
MRKIIQTPAAPAAVGPYSQGVASGDLLCTAGQVPIDPATGKLAPGDIAAQTHQVMKNLAAVLAAAGAGWADVIKTTCFLADMADFAAFNAVYAEYFAGIAPPARSTFAVAGLPLGARVEVELLARLPG